jgi:hypothetical protein
MTATMTAVPEDRSVPAGEGFCGRAGCGRPLPAGERGRSRRFCSDECRRRHYNALRAKPAPAAPVPEDGPGAALGKLSQLLAEASGLAATASGQVAETGSARVASVLAEAEASRHAATAAAQSLAAAAATARAERAETALDAERTERRALTDRLTAALAQARTRNRTPAMLEKDKQPREAQLRPA